MEWFNNLDNTVKVALISALAVILVPLINGIFTLCCKDKKKTVEAGHKIEQVSKGSNNVVIGVQNNYKREK